MNSEEKTKITVDYDTENHEAVVVRAEFAGRDGKPTWQEVRLFEGGIEDFMCQHSVSVMAFCLLVLSKIDCNDPRIKSMTAEIDTGLRAIGIEVQP